MSQAQLPNELATFLENWTTDPNNAKDAFVRFKDFLLTTPDVRFDFKARPGVSYSLRAANAKNDERPLFVLGCGGRRTRSPLAFRLLLRGYGQRSR